ncbi:MAG: ABC transporter permease [Atribacterota bacterium]|nr:ABC transporter permease [Candidatus Atribacteria bacterium]
MSDENIRKSSGINREWPVLIGKSWIYLFLLGEIVVFSYYGTGFFSAKNFQNVMVNSITIMLLAAGEIFVIISGGIDLSVGFVMGFASVMSAKMMVTFYTLGWNQNLAILMGILIALLIGFLPGLLNGFLVTKMRVPPFIATFGMYGIAYGFSEIISYNVPITKLPPGVGAFGNGYLLYYLPGKLLNWFSQPVGLARAEIRELVPVIPNIFVISLLIIFIFGFILSRTRFGQHTYAIGGNIDAARRAGINVDRHLMKVYMVSSLFASLGGIMYVLRFVNGRADAGSARMLDSVVAVVIGGASLYGGTGSMVGSIIGTFIIAILETGMVNLGIPTFNKYIYVGTILIVAVLIDQLFPELVRRGD